MYTHLQLRDSARPPVTLSTLHRMREDGEAPGAAPGTFVEDVPPAQIREHMGRTQVEVAEALRIPVATLRNWEQGRVRIDPAARALFRILNRDPKHALKALQSWRKAG